MVGRYAPTAAEADGSVTLGRIDASESDQARGAITQLFQVEREGLLPPCGLRCPGENLVHILGPAHAMFFAVVTHLRLLDSRRCWRLMPEVHPIDGPIHLPLGIAWVDALDHHVADTTAERGQQERELSGMSGCAGG